MDHPLTFKIHSVVPLNIMIEEEQPSVLLVEYPNGLEGADDSTGFLWFSSDDLHAPDGNPFLFPGDRTFHPTPEKALEDARIWLSA